MATFWPASSGGGGASVTVSATAPENPSDGDLWFDSTDANMYIWYVENESGQWVQVSGAGAAEFSEMLLPGM